MTRCDEWIDLVTEDRRLMQKSETWSLRCRLDGDNHGVHQFDLSATSKHLRSTAKKRTVLPKESE